MTEKLKSEGKCHFCGEMKTQRSINTHLSKHLQQMEKDPEIGKKIKSYLVYVRAGEMFLSLWVNADTSFAELDHFLRGIWLECCGHLSSFRDKNGYYKQPTSKDTWGLEPDEQEVPMTFTLRKVMEKGKKLDYEYDFGSTTYLSIEVKGEYTIEPAEYVVVLLSRNEPLKILCQTCQKAPAAAICSVEGWDSDSLFCEKCAKKHAKTCKDFADYARLEVVNSPRMGICAYGGGQIDLDRDGVFNER